MGEWGRTGADHARLRRHSGHVHSEKGGGELQGRLRLHPLFCYLDESGEALAGILRPRAGNPGANTAADHLAVLQQAMEQLPEPAWGMEIFARADSAGVTHDFINALRDLEIRFSISFDLTEPVAMPSWRCQRALGWRP